MSVPVSVGPIQQCPIHVSGVIMDMSAASGRRRCIVTLPLIGRAHAQSDLCVFKESLLYPGYIDSTTKAIPVAITSGHIACFQNTRT